MPNSNQLKINSNNNIKNNNNKITIKNNNYFQDDNEQIIKNYEKKILQKKIDITVRF